MDAISPDSGLGHGSRQCDVDRAAADAIELGYRGFTILLWRRDWGGGAACWCDDTGSHWMGLHATPDLARQAAREAIDRRLSEYDS